MILLYFVTQFRHSSSLLFPIHAILPSLEPHAENQQPEHLREYFRDRLVHYRELSKRFPLLA
ncbi:DNA polymerase III subunit theta [Providencia huashanensis]|uniref:DNA polymerase III subunit theta n=1 Tax=Providencia huashanensis TaxID=3037798 RepID=UPI0040459FE9